MEALLNQPWWVLALVGILVAIVGGAFVWALFSLVALPILAALSRLFCGVDNSTAESAKRYLVGTTSLTIPVGGLGEVMVTGNGRARQTYAARAYDAGTRIAQGTRVVVIELKEGVAYVQPAQGAPDKELE
ncbi:hypothetical protein [Lacticaseibacillus kribbianus]|uniref:hypothetical protein n=1 Tax=Lacticaseibacillus kribbianus TaxID=2926292 RepID=UPI001CD4A78B|nr:hypothetical protein [Lacticaseibacillus kribbianus]